MSYKNGYNHPTPEELAEEVRATVETQDEWTRELEAQHVEEMIAELEALGYTVIAPK